jgi:hypothetical protein
MEVLKPIIDAVAHYHRHWRHPDRPPPLVSGLYSLFPDQSAAVQVIHRWPQPWPQSGSPGVYLFFCTELRLQYVGMSSSLGRRLGNYFRYSAGRGSACEIVHSGWRTPPAYVATVAVADAFEAPSLEHFLIETLHPLQNILGSLRDQAGVDAPA